MMSSSQDKKSTNTIAEKKPDIQSALKFLQQVKEHMPAEYDTFLEILTRFRSRNVDAEMVVDFVAALLDGREWLLEGFSQFLPPSRRQSLLDRFVKDSPSHELPENGAGTPSKRTKQTKRTASAFDSLVGTPPVEPKRKRENVGDMDLRPNAILSQSYCVGKRMSQQHIYQAQYKKGITPANMPEIWQKVVERVDARVEQILADRENWIPSIDINDILEGKVAQSVIDRIKIAGIVKIRRTIPKTLAESMNKSITDDFKSYLKVDPDQPETYNKIYNDTNPKAFTFGGVQEIYYTHAQFEARQHENMHAVRVWLNHLWDHVDKKTQEPIFLPEVETTYIDRWRHRLPGYHRQSGMKEHIDNGAMCRWADPSWQQVYARIMAGDIDGYEPWYAGSRASTAGSFFRSFQGWLALSPQGPNDGGLEVVPMVSEAIAYVLLRPFRDDVPMHQFCGVNDSGMGGGDTMEISSRWHAPLLRGKIPVGMVDAGDSVWWHPDLIHGVESEHLGTQPSNVLYIPAAPMCTQNARYLVKQREAFQGGLAPPDFPDLQIERGSPRRATVAQLSQLGRQQMGIEPFSELVIKGDGPEGQAMLARKRALFAKCQEILFGSEGKEDHKSQNRKA